MNLIKMLLWIVFLGVNVMASDKTVDIQEKLWPPQSGPLNNIGNVTLSEMDVNGKVFMSHRDMWTVKNVSQSPIVAIAETFLFGHSKGLLQNK